MTLSTRERKALNAAYTQKGVKPNDNSLRGVGGQTLASLVQRGLLEQIQNQATGRAMYRTTPAGRAGLQELAPSPKPKKSGARLKTLTLRGTGARRVSKPKKA